MSKALEITGSILSFNSLDNHFAQFICSLNGTIDPVIQVTAALVNNAISSGHVCVDLTEYAEKTLNIENASFTIPALPSLSNWITALESSKVVGKPGDFKPLILHKNLLYLNRYWNYEYELAQSILSRVNTDLTSNTNLANVTLDALFPKNSSTDIDWQKIAAAVSMIKALTIITGGPGTGKTSTVARILTLLINQDTSKKLRIALAAPTGKAAARLRESLRSSQITSISDDSLITHLPEDTFTLHRLLRPIHNSPYFNYTKENSLPFDIIVVDEASMIDLALMAKLLDAVSEKTKLILLGDKDQLASVEAGAVLGDICDRGNAHGFSQEMCNCLKQISSNCSLQPSKEPPIADCIVALQKSYRFDSTSGIGQLSATVNSGDFQNAKRIITSGNYPDIIWRDIRSEQNLAAWVSSLVERYYLPLFSMNDPTEAIYKLDNFRFLCATRSGPFGVEKLNELIEKIVFSKIGHPSSPSWYHGKPIMVNQNTYSLDLYNGDTGIVLKEGRDETTLKAWFMNSDKTLRSILPRRLPSVETVYAMTVHKSQGSEFNTVTIILPPTPSPLVTRELLYTAITRAKKNVELWCTMETFEQSILQKVQRRSGLRDLLWGD